MGFTKVSLSGPDHYPSYGRDDETRSHESDNPPSGGDTQANPLLTPFSSYLNHAQKPSVVPCAPTDAAGAEGAPDIAIVLRHVLVRELIRENERMLVELAGLREAHRFSYTTQPRLVMEESAARSALTLAESGGRAVCASRAHALLAAHVQRLELQFKEETRKAAEVRGFAESAQTQLATSSQLHAHGIAAEKDTYPSPLKVRRGGRAVDVDDDSRRTSLEEITNVRRSVKRLRSVESSDDGGTPTNPPPCGGGAQDSPDALTKMRKIIS